MNSASLILRRCEKHGRSAPITNGVPFAAGRVPAGAQFSLLDADGAAQPVQTKVLARWPDRSVRWLLVDTQTSGARKESPWTLRWGKTARQVDAASPVKLARKASWRLQNAHAALDLTPGGLLSINESYGVELTLKVSGKAAVGRIDHLAVETAGPLRTTVLGTGAFYDRRGGRLFGLRLRVTLFGNSGKMRLEPMIQFDAASGLMHRLTELNCRITPRDASVAATVSVGTDGKERCLDGAKFVRLLQRDDQYAAVEGARTSAAGRRAPGYAILQTDDGRQLAAALKDFWQQWPKSIETDGRSLIIGLLPRFEPGTFGHMQPDHKYQYLFKGNAYNLRTSQSCRWELWLEPGGQAAALAELANAPPLLAAVSQHAVDSGQWGLIAAQTPATAAFDRWADDLFAAFQDDNEARRNYGQMNYGDWYGERYVNWGNNEYDTPNELLIQFARTANPAYYDSGVQSARHMSEVDVVNYTNEDLTAHFHAFWERPDYPVRPGMVHEHTLGHVSGHFTPEKVRRLFLANEVGSGNKHPYLCLDPYNLGHVWTTGLVRAYFLSGDPWFKEVAVRIGDNLARLVEDRRMKFAGPQETHSGRMNGWTMLALAGVYMLDHQKRYVRAMKTLAEDKLAEQDPVCGGWLYELPLGHCMCQKRKHVGEAGFLTSIQVNALAAYYRLSGDRRIPEAIRRAINNLNTATWDEIQASWRYTSCPASAFIGQFGPTMAALANSAVITGDAEHRRILAKAWEAKFATLMRQLAEGKSTAKGDGMGKFYTAMMLGCAEVVATLNGRP